MRTRRVSLLLLSAILNFITVTYGHLYFGVPSVHGFNLYRNPVPQQPVFVNQPINNKLLDLLKEKQRNQVIIQNINRRSGLNNNNQESGLESLRQQGQTVGQNNEDVVNPNPELVERLREQNPGEPAMRNGLNFNNNLQSILERLRQTQKDQNVVQNVGQIGANPIFDLMQRLRQQNRGQFVMQNVNRRFGTNSISNNPVARLEPKQLQREQFVVQNIGRNNGLSPSLESILEGLRQQNHGQFIMQNVNRRFGLKSINKNPEARLEPKYLPGEQFGLQNIERNHGLSPNFEGLLERLTQNNRGQFVVQNVNRKIPSNYINNNPEVDLESLAQLQRESVVQNMAKGNYINPSLESLPVSLQRLQQYNHEQIVMQNSKQKSLNPKNNYFNTLVGPLKLQHREKTMSQSIGQNDGLNFGNIQALLTQPDHVLIQSVKRLSEHGNSHLNSLLEQLKEHRNRVTKYNNINPSKKRYQNNDLEIMTLEDQQNNEHKHGFKQIINHKNYVSLNNNKTPFEHRVDHANRNLLLNIFIEKYIPKNIKRILYNPRTKEEKERVPMLLKNYKIITFAFADFLRYSNPLAGYIKSLRIISENMKQRAKNDVVPVQFIQKEIENLSQLGFDASGFRIKKIGSNPGVLVQEVNLRVEDLPENEEALEERLESNLNEGILTVPETNTENDIETDENGNFANLEDTRLQVPNYEMMREVNSEALHQTTKEESAPLENIEEDLTVLQSNEDAAPTVIGLDHLSESENDVLRDEYLNDNNDNNNNSHRENVTDERELVVDHNDEGNLVVSEAQHPEIETEESETEYMRDTDMKENQNEISRPNLMINTMINEVFCESLDTDEAIDVMQEVLYNVVGELSKMFRLDDVILNVTRNAIYKTLYDNSLYSNKRCEIDPYDLGSITK